MLLFEFTVVGPPVSHQARRMERLANWKTEVNDAARELWPAEAPPFGFPLAISVKYFYDHASPAIDNDNMIKPIQDSLIGLVYNDDSQLVHIEATKISIEGQFRIRGISKVLAEAFIAGREFLHVAINHPPSMDDLS